MESFWFLLVLWTSCNKLFNTFLVSGDVCDEVVFHSSMFKSPFLSKLTSIKMYKSLRGVSASVFFLMCSLKGSPSSVPLGEQLVNEAVDPAELLSRETENGDVDLIIVAVMQTTVYGLVSRKLWTEDCLLRDRGSCAEKRRRTLVPVQQ